MDESLTAEDLQRLPLRAIVALCARCSSRSRPDFDLPGNTPNRGRVMAAVDAAIRMARDFAAGQAVPSEAEDIVSAAMSAAGEAPDTMFGVSATKAGWAADVAIAIHNGQTALAPPKAQMCVRAVGKMAIAAHKDFERLQQLGLGSFPELGQPIDISEGGPLGPLWPGGSA